MRDRGPSIDIDNLPDIQTENRNKTRPEPQARPTKKMSAPAATSSSAKTSIIVQVVLVFIIGALGFLSFQLYAQATKLDARVIELEGRLSSTGENLSQSGVALQLAIKEQGEHLAAQDTEIKKLWTSAWKQNQADIQAQGKQIAAMLESQKTAAAEIAALTKTDESYHTEIEALNAKAGTLAAMDASIKEQAKLLETLKKQLADMDKTNSTLRKKIDESSGWIESNNAFRQQTNQSLNRLEQQVKSLQTTNTTIIKP